MSVHYVLRHRQGNGWHGSTGDVLRAPATAHLREEGLVETPGCLSLSMSVHSDPMAQIQDVHDRVKESP